MPCTTTEETQVKNTPRSQNKLKIWAVRDETVHSRSDAIATEEPLEIRLVNPQYTIAITMRTPGADFDLVAGFLYSEGVIRQREDIEAMSYCINPQLDGQQQYNIVNINLREELVPNLPSLERHFFTTSACGVCGKTSIDALKIRGCEVMAANQPVAAEILYSLASQLNSAQKIFAATGGLHAAALFDFQGQLLKLREDVGRHNALDKLIGSAFLADEIPLTNRIVMVSGRASFEILQKSIMAGVPMVCAVSAPSSLAVSLAEEFGITLVGFLRGKRFNVYTGWERIIVN
jgi:FdhD protein